MSKILGLDLGSNSIGLTIRDTDKGETFSEQLDLFTSTIFPSGVGKDKNGEFSYAAERTKHRSSRRLYQARKYRIWATLDLLIEEGLCPLSIEDLDKWRKYDKTKGLHRQYPNNAEFEQWVRLDFNGDGMPEYTSPYQLRAEIMEKQFDFSKQIDKYKLGRILYHIAQRRGFKSSKGETIKETSNTENIDFSVDDLKKSESNKSQELTKFMKENGCKTVGTAFYELEKRGIRIKGSQYQAVRSQYKDEIREIFVFQNGLTTESNLYKRIISDKKGEGTIFYKRSLRSQKGKVGNCTLEPNKARCPISHPEYEEYRAWCFINNIKYRKTIEDDWQTLSLDLKQQLFKEKFLRVAPSFNFKEITDWLSLKLGCKLSGEKDKQTINYKDNTNVSSCPISARIKNLLGEDYKQWRFETDKTRINKKTGEEHKITYDYIDIWHICFSCDDPDYIQEFGSDILHLDEKENKKLSAIFMHLQQGYASLSLKAIKNINAFLRRGFIYTDSVLLAKLPDIFGYKWKEAKEKIITGLETVISENRHNNEIYNIVNALIADYKSLDFEERFAEHNTDYQLQKSDLEAIEKKLISSFGENTWNGKTEEDRKLLRQEVTSLYQIFFASSNRKYFDLQKLSEALAEYLIKEYTYLDVQTLQSIYHPSMIEMYSLPKPTLLDDGRLLTLLGSPVIGAVKNPMAMRILHTLRSQINSLLMNGKIDENTKIVVEMARDVDDANRRWAIMEYQKKQEEENKAIVNALQEFFDKEERNISIEERTKAKLLFEQDFLSQTDGKAKKSSNKSKEETRWVSFKDQAIKKYKLWKEQDYCCIYTGKIISLSDLFEDNKVDFEHTIPRSISFDDSLSNLTVCEADFNRKIKKNSLPTLLSNYNEIKERLKPWFERVENANDRIKYWSHQSSLAQTKERKDECIRQRHLWQFEYDYWYKKVSAFTTTEFKSSFRNNQLNDTRIITKYAFHYLKTVFNKVEVQKGEVTAIFRKIAEVESVNEKKDRSKHSHHAIDAAILTIIPSAAKRDRMLELFYKIEEAQKLRDSAQEKEYRDSLDKEKKELPKRASEIREYIENNIIVGHISKDRTLLPAKKRKRIRGKVVPLRDSEGNIIYETNEDGTFKKDRNGNRIPKPQYWIKGDSIRGRLHKDSFYGAIELNGERKYVIRCELKYKKNDNDTGFKSWDDLEKKIVDKDLFDIMKKQHKGKDFKDACEAGIYMLDKDENKVNKIRHIRCFATTKNPLQIKEQTYKSTKEYKNFYYAESADLYAMSKYKDNETGQEEYRAWNLFEVSKNREEEKMEVPKNILSKKDKKMTLEQNLISGDMVLLYEDYPEELYDMDIDMVQKRLYKVRGFEKPYGVILIHSANAQVDKDLGKGASVKDFNNLPQKIRQSVNQLKFLVCGVDFQLQDGSITFKNKH